MRSLRLRRNPPIDVSRLHEVSNADIQNAILAYQPTQGTTRAEHLRKAREILAKNEYAVGNQIGRGTMATVYELVAYPKYVVKLTYDPTDAALMAEIRHMSRSLREGASLPKGLPDVATVAALNDGLYAIIVERLVPLDKDKRKRLYPVGYGMNWGATFSMDSDLWKQWKKQPDSPEYALLNAARVVHDLGFIPYDLAPPSNIMQRPGTGEVVVSDFGYSSPRKTVRGRNVARLKNPHHARAPHPHFAPRPRHLMPTRRNPVIDLSEFDASLGQGGVTSNLRREMGLVLSANRGLTRARDVLARNGFALGKELGEGTAATVYEMANDPRWVMKITADVTDVSVLADAQFLPRDRDGNLPPGIPEVAGAYDLGEGLYGVMVERLYPLSDDEFGRVDREMPALNHGWATDVVAERYIGLDPRDPFRPVLSAILTVRDRGFRMSDIGGNNVLKRANGAFVISDFGYAGVELPKRRYSRDLLLLKNPRTRRKNPVLDLKPYETDIFAEDPTRTFGARIAAFMLDDEKNDHGKMERVVKQKFAEKRFPVGEFVGSGNFATVYEIEGEPGWVVKATTDPMDAAISAELAYQQTADPRPPPPGIPKVRDVFVLAETEWRTPIYGIVIERLLPLSSRERLRANDATRDFGKGFPVVIYPDEWGDPSEVNAPMYKAILTAILYVKSLGFALADIHAGNILRRENGDYVISDFGMSGAIKGRASTSRDIRVLNNPRRRGGRR